MKRKFQVVVLVILGLTVLGFNLIAAVSAGGGQVPNGTFIGAERILYFEDTTICESDASYYVIDWWWPHYEGSYEWEEFPVPVKMELYIGSMEIKLYRFAIGRGNLPPFIAEPSKQGPVYLWYAYFEPYYFESNEEGYTVLTMQTCKNPDSPSERMLIDSFEVTLFVDAA
ncbi:MAG: hypothetical protein ACXABV_18920 [Candidatus Thorarchaeota archaeon]|jgi:hypothetical protein